MYCLASRHPHLPMTMAHANAAMSSRTRAIEERLAVSSILGMDFCTCRDIFCAAYQSHLVVIVSKHISALVVLAEIEPLPLFVLGYPQAHDCLQYEKDHSTTHSNENNRCGDGD